MIISLGTGTVLAVGLLFLSYQLAIGPEGLKANVPTLTAALGVNKGCVDCHDKKSPGVVQSYHDSKHSSRGVQCLDCHSPVPGQQTMTKDHENVALVAKPSPKNCAKCHGPVVAEFAKSNHAAKSWYAVDGAKECTPAGLRHSHPLVAPAQPPKASKSDHAHRQTGQDDASQAGTSQASTRQA